MLQALNLGSSQGLSPLGSLGREAGSNEKENSQNIVEKSFKETLAGASLKDKKSTIKDNPNQKKSNLEEFSENKKSEAKKDGSESEKIESSRLNQTKSAKASRSSSSTKQAGRNKVIQEFMDSFESKFQVPPTRLVEAMTQLPPLEQMKTAEETAEWVISTLDLPQEQKLQAQIQYGQFLQQLNQVENQPSTDAIAQPYLMEQPFLQSRQNMLLSKNQNLLNSAKDVQSDFLDPSVLDKQSLLSSSEDKNFLIHEDPSWTTVNYGDSLVKDTIKRNEWGESQSISDVDSAIEVSDQASGPVSGPWETMNESIPNLNHELKNSNIDPHKNTADPKELLLASIPAAELAKTVRRSEQNELQNQTYENMFDSNSGSTNIFKDNYAAELQNTGSSFQENMNFNQQNLASNAKDFKDSIADLNQEVIEPELLNDGRILAESTSESFGKTQDIKQFGVNAGSLQQSQPQTYQEANIRQLMNQAQYLIRQGGGEMKVDLNPEGLGRVQMKVLVQDGKVQVQMAADSKEAKNTLESGLHELRQSLSAHKLSMEHVRVDVVSSMSDSGSSQLQQSLQNFQEQADKQINRQFWNQFNQNFSNREQKESFYNVQDKSGYNRKSQAPLQPMTSNSSSAYKKYAHKGQGLNLVA